MAAFYKFKNRDIFRALATAFDVAAGHDHNGTNSKAVSGASLAAASVTPAKMSATANTRFLSIPIENLAGGADITASAVFAVPAGMTATLTKASIIMQGSAAGVDDANTCVIALSDGTNAIVSKTYNTATTMPAANAEGDLGELNATHKVLAAGERLHFTVTNGATADTPAMVLQVAYTLADAA